MEARKAERSKEWNKALWRVNCCISLLFLLLTHYAAMYPIRRLHKQYDQIWRFIWLWATFQSLWKQFICPNLPHSYTIFVKVSKSLIFLVKSFLGNFYRHLATFYWSHCSLQTLCSRWAGALVMGGDSRSKGRGFEFRHRILDGHLFTYICCKNL